MTDNDLKKMAQMPTPKPRRSARDAAITAAMAAFDKSVSPSEVEHTAQRKRRNFNSRSKGSAQRARPSSDQTLLERKVSMRSLTKYAVAASVVAVAVIGPASFYLLRDQKLEETGDGLGGLMDLQTTSETRLRADLEERPTTEPKKIAAQKPPVTLPAPASPQAKASREFKTAKLKPGNDTVTTHRGGVRGGGTQDGDAKPSADQKVARPAKIMPPAGGRLKQLGEFYTHNGLNRQPTDGLGAVAGGGGWTRSMGGATSNQALSPNSVPYDVADRKPRSQDLVAAGRLLNFGDDNRQLARQSRDKFNGAAPNPIKQVATEPVSTFSLDVDTASYAFVRRALNGGRLPSKDAVRVEELINYFSYDTAPPENADTPFNIAVRVVPSPWSASNKLVHVSVKGYELSQSERPPANLVFLVDVSGSMTFQDKLPLVKTALRMLVNELKPDDTIGIVTYASGTTIALEPTKVAHKHKVLSVIGGLRSGGSTAGARGIQDAYRLAETHFNPEGVNRIVLATDGDFNVGITNRKELKGYIARKRKSGVFLSILGVGRGNYNDALMQSLAQNGNGTASYIDTLNEARKVLVDEASSTLFTIAKDVKVQVEFNPQRVQSYRLIGYETRALKREDFNNDRVDAGDVGSGHNVTAIYEITPVGAPAAVDPLRYGEVKTDRAPQSDPEAEFGFVKLRYKLPKETTSKMISQAITPREELSKLDAAPEDTRFSIAVAGFGQLLHDNPALDGFGYDDVIELARGARGEDRFGYRSEFINLVRTAKTAQP